MQGDLRLSVFSSTHYYVTQPVGVVLLWVVRAEVRPARLFADKRAGDHGTRDGELVSEVKRLLPGVVHLGWPCNGYLRGLPGQLFDSLAGANQAAAVAHHSTTLPHRFLQVPRYLEGARSLFTPKRRERALYRGGHLRRVGVAKIALQGHAYRPV